MYYYFALDIWLNIPPIMRENQLLLLHELLFHISSKESFICNIPTVRIVYYTAFVTQVVEPGWNENISMGSSSMINPKTHMSRCYSTELCPALQITNIRDRK